MKKWVLIGFIFLAIFWMIRKFPDKRNERKFAGVVEQVLEDESLNNQIDEVVEENSEPVEDTKLPSDVAKNYDQYSAPKADVKDKEAFGDNEAESPHSPEQKIEEDQGEGIVTISELPEEYLFIANSSMQPLYEGYYVKELNAFDGYYVGSFRNKPVSVNLNFARKKGEIPITCIRIYLENEGKKSTQTMGTFFPVHFHKGTVFMLLKDADLATEYILQLDFKSNGLHAGFVKSDLPGFTLLKKRRPISDSEQDCDLDGQAKSTESAR